MKFLIDRCAGHRLAQWLCDQGHDVLEVRELGSDPGDRALLEYAADDDRILVTIDTDFGELIYLHEIPHTGLSRLPDTSAEQRIALIDKVLKLYYQALKTRAVITVCEGRIRVSSLPSH